MILTKSLFLFTIWNFYLINYVSPSSRGSNGDFRLGYNHYTHQFDDDQVRRSRRSVVEIPPVEIKADAESVLENVDISEEVFNKTLEKKFHVNETVKDNHKYYESTTVLHSDEYWVDLEELNKTSRGIVKEHSMLSQSYRHAATISLSFSFPFYGHYVENITIATGGFLYVGDYVHSWLAATQYIAPLMANFDHSQHEAAKIRYADNGTALVVEWHNVYLKANSLSVPAQSSSDNLSSKSSSSNLIPNDDVNTTTTTTTSKDEEEVKLDDEKSDASPPPKEEGPFTFQVIIHKNGDIVFAYKTIPIIITTIEDNVHPVKVGLSDAYIIDRIIFFVKRKTIYEYHRVSLKNKAIANSSAIIFTAIPTCNIQLDCDSCLSLAKNNVDDEKSGNDSSTVFECQWCPSLNRCSDGMDRHRQNWLKNSCDKYHFDKKSQCGKSLEIPKKDDFDHYGGGDSDHHFLDHHNHEDETFNDNVTKKGVQEGLTATGSTHANIAGVVVVCLLICSIVGWFGYAYFFPHSWSGQLLIKYRPTRWHWRRGEARYTAASIHM